MPRKLFILFLLPAWVFAHPVAYEDSTQVELRWQEAMQDAQVYYSTTAKDAVGLWYHQMENDDDGDTHKGLTVQYNRLFKRWYQRNAQANLYGTIGLGMADTRTENEEPAFRLGLQADYETRQIYSMFRADLWQADSFSHGIFKAALGLAPYKADFDQLNMWLVLGARYITDWEDEIEITPKLRFFYQNVFWELGANLDGDPFVMLMVHY